MDIKQDMSLEEQIKAERQSAIRWLNSPWFLEIEPKPWWANDPNNDIYIRSMEGYQKDLIIAYFQQPYIDIYVRWRYENPLFSAENSAILTQISDINLTQEAIRNFVYPTYGLDYLLKDLYTLYKLCPQEAEQPVKKETEKRFIRYLNTVFKPAFLEFMELAQSGEYRPREVIASDIKSANESINRHFEFTMELDKPITDLHNLIFKYLDSSLDFKWAEEYRKFHTSSLQSNFFKIYNPQELKTLLLANTTTKRGKNTVERNLLNEISIASNKKLIRIEKGFESKFKAFRPSTTRLMLSLQAALTDNPSKPVIKISTRDYISAIGKNPDNEKEFYNTLATIKEDLNSLHVNVSAGSLNVELVQATDADKDYITVQFTDIYKSICVKSALSSYPRALLKVSDTAMYIGRKLSENYFNDNNAKTGQHQILSVRCILEEVPTIPTKEDVSNRHYKQQIIDPFVRALDDLSLQGVIKSWEFCNAKKMPLTDEQCSKQESYSTFIELYVLYDIVLDDITEAEQKKRRKKAADKKEAALEKKRAKAASDIVKADRIERRQQKKSSV